MPTYRPLNVGVQQSEALAAAYISSPSDDPVMVTLEVMHPNGNALRMVNDWELLTATLEDDAPLNAGEEVTFAGIPFSIVRPPETDGGAPGAVTCTIDNLSAQITELVMAIQESGSPVRVILRTYLPSDTSAPHELPVLTMYVRSPVVITSSHQAQFQCSFGDLTNRKFPKLTYRSETHPTLSAS
jgi:hypothetical protein